MTGKIKFHSEKGFGFIISDEDDKDYFFHVSSIENGPEIFSKDDRVEFEPDQNEKGLLAKRIRTLEE